MSDLQLGLLVIGAVIIAAVWGYNRWLDSRYRKLENKRFSSSHADALLDAGEGDAAQHPDGEVPPAPAPSVAEPSPTTAFAGAPGAGGERIEPTLSGGAEAAAADPDLDETPSTVAAGAAAAAAPAANAVAAVTPVVSIDFVVHLSGDTDAAQVLQMAGELSAEFVKPVWINGWNEATGAWVALSPGSAPGGCKAFALGIQLVNRNGALPAADIARFGAGVQAMAERAGLRSELPDAATAAAEARALDQFCGEVDIQIVLNLAAVGPAFAGTKIRALAESAGFALEEDGCFRLRNEEGAALYVLSNQASPDARFDAARMRELACAALALQYDLPRVPGGVRSFDQFCDIARNFAGVLGGRLVDDNRMEISPVALRTIRAQVQQVQAAMDARGLPAGGAAAMRLFS